MHASFAQGKMLRPVSCLCTGNMMLFDAEGKIRRYETPEQIVQEFFDLRLSFYAKRKAALLKVGANACGQNPRPLAYPANPEVANQMGLPDRSNASCECGTYWCLVERQMSE